MSRTRTTHKLVAGLAALALLASGCGGSDDEPSAGASVEGGKCSGEKVRFQLSFFPNAQFVAFLAAQELGYYDDLGLDVELVPGGPNINSALQIAQGNVDMALTQFVEVLNSNAAGADLTQVAQVFQQDPVRFVTMPDSGIETPADFKGHVIASEGANGQDPELAELLRGAGLSNDDIETSPASPSITDLISGKVDVFQAQVFFHVAELRELGYDYPDGVNVIDPNVEGAGVAAHGITVNPDFMKEHSQAVTCFLAASLKGTQAVIDDPEGAVKIVDATQEAGLASTEANTENVAQTVALMVQNSDGEAVDPFEMDRDLLERSQEILLDAGVVKEESDLGFVDDAPLEAARELLAEDSAP
jgi:NitT/TauT family transport system substrate-binding protein